MIGNKELLDSHDIISPTEINKIVESVILVAIDGDFAGYVTIADELKEDAHQAIKEIRKTGISKIIMLSGDKDCITRELGREIGLDQAIGGLLPEDKLDEVESLKNR